MQPLWYWAFAFPLRSGSAGHHGIDEDFTGTLFYWRSSRVLQDIRDFGKHWMTWKFDLDDPKGQNQQMQKGQSRSGQLMRHTSYSLLCIKTSYYWPKGGSSNGFIPISDAGALLHEASLYGGNSSYCRRASHRWDNEGSKQPSGILRRSRDHSNQKNRHDLEYYGFVV